MKPLIPNDGYKHSTYALVTPSCKTLVLASLKLGTLSIFRFDHDALDASFGHSGKVEARKFSGFPSNFDFIETDDSIFVSGIEFQDDGQGIVFGIVLSKEGYFDYGAFGNAGALETPLDNCWSAGAFEKDCIDLTAFQTTLEYSRGSVIADVRYQDAEGTWREKKPSFLLESEFASGRLTISPNLGLLFAEEELEKLDYIPAPAQNCDSSQTQCKVELYLRNDSSRVVTDVQAQCLLNPRSNYFTGVTRQSQSDEVKAGGTGYADCEFEKKPGLVPEREILGYVQLSYVTDREGNRIFANYPILNNVGSECGLAGPSIDSRIRDCANHPGHVFTGGNGKSWNLVARKRDPNTRKVHSVWRDSATGRLWTNFLETPEDAFAHGFYDAGGNWLNFAAREFGYSAVFGSSSDHPCMKMNSSLLAGLDGLTEFRLPLDSEVHQAALDGLPKLLRAMYFRIWALADDSNHYLNDVSFREPDQFEVNSNFYSDTGIMLPVVCVDGTSL